MERLKRIRNIKGSIKKRQKVVIGVSIILVAIIVGTKIFSSLDLEWVKRVIQSQGNLGKVIYVVIVYLSTVISLISSIVLWPAALLAYGFSESVILTFIANFAGGMTNFFLARKYGRPLVRKLVGKDSIDKVDKFTSVSGLRAFIVLRVLASNYYDFVSYAAGLTNLAIKPYTIVTCLSSLLWMVFVFTILDKALDMGTGYLAVFGVGGYLIGLFGLLVALKMYSNSISKSQFRK